MSANCSSTAGRSASSSPLMPRAARRSESASASSARPSARWPAKRSTALCSRDRSTGSATAVAVRLRRVGPSTAAERSLGATSGAASEAWSGTRVAGTGRATGDVAGRPSCAAAPSAPSSRSATWRMATGVPTASDRARRWSRHERSVPAMQSAPRPRNDASFSSAMASAASGSLRLNVPPKPQQRWASSSGQGTTEHPSTAATAARVAPPPPSSRSEWHDWCRATRVGVPVPSSGNPRATRNWVSSRVRPATARARPSASVSPTRRNSSGQ